MVKRAVKREKPASAREEAGADAPKKTKKSDDSDESASGRKSGGMSLRPGRRVNVKFEVTDYDEAAAEKVDDPGDSGSEDADVERDFDQVLGEGGFGRRKSKSATEDDEETDDGLLDDADFHELSNVVPSRRNSRRKIALNRKVKLVGESGEDEAAKRQPYEVCKDQICCVCSTELDFADLESYKNLYEDRTKGGKSLYEMFEAIVRQEVQPSFYGSRVCHKCAEDMDEIEELYQKYRRATESFLDTFVLGQRVLDADACSQTKTATERYTSSSSAAAEDDDDITTITASKKQAPVDVAAFVDLSKCVVKLIDAGNASFNAFEIGYDFQVPVAKIFKTSVVATPEQMPPADDEAGGGGGDGDQGGTITLMFDMDTGVVERAPPIAVAEMTADMVEVGLPLVYMTPEEFDVMPHSVAKGTVYLSRTDMAPMGFRVLLGRRIRQQVLISGAVAAEYERQISSADAPFTCSDCSASFRHFHMLSNHVHMVHASQVDGDDAAAADDNRTTTRLPGVRGAGGTVAKDGSIVVSNLTPRTGEVATMEKPFQCEHCDRCFSEYLTLSAHTDHYHGFTRRCNIEGCEAKVNSIQAFVAHYVSHAKSDFLVPSEFKDKMKTVLPCPMCNINIQGVWKYFQHTFTHDKEARFKCPACGKRIHKVQNYKDHLQRHRTGGAPVSAISAPATSVIALGDGSIVVESTGAGTAGGPYSCKECGKVFTVLSKLRYHAESHLSKDEWKYSCESCDTTFPSISRLKVSSPLLLWQFSLLTFPYSCSCMPPTCTRT